MRLIPPFAPRTYPLKATTGSSIAPVAELAGLADLSAASGNLAFVETVRAWFTFDPESTETPNGITVLTGAAPGRWLRLAVPHLSWQEQDEWHLNLETGNNEADGATPSTAIRDYTELVRRTGAPWRIDDRIVHLYWDAPAIDDVQMAISVSATALVVVHGRQTSIGTGTVTAFAAENFVNEATLVTDTARTTWPVGALVRIPSGPRAGVQFWIAADLGGGVARTSVPILINVVVDPLNGTKTNLSPGDPYEIVSETDATNLTFEIDGGGSVLGNRGVVVIENVHFPTFLTSRDQPLVLVSCRSSFYRSATINTNNHCFMTAVLATANGNSNSGLYLNALMITFGVWLFNEHPVMENTSPGGKPGSQHFYEDYVAFFNTPNPITVWNGMRTYLRHGTFGTGNTGDAGIQVQAGGQFRYSPPTTFTLAGPTNDVTLGTKTAIPRIDPATNLPGGASVTLSYANLLATYGSGGFGGSAVDLYSSAAFLQVPDSFF